MYLKIILLRFGKFSQISLDFLLFFPASCPWIFCWVRLLRPTLIFLFITTVKPAVSCAISHWQLPAFLSASLSAVIRPFRSCLSPPLQSKWEKMSCFLQAACSCWKWGAGGCFCKVRPAIFRLPLAQRAALPVLQPIMPPRCRSCLAASVQGCSGGADCSQKRTSGRNISILGAKRWSNFL